MNNNLTTAEQVQVMYRVDGKLKIEEKMIDGTLHIRICGDCDFFEIDLPTLSHWYWVEQLRVKLLEEQVLRLQAELESRTFEMLGV